MRYLLAFLLVPSLAWGDWGGTVLQDHPDSMETVWLRGNAIQQGNYGKSPTSKVECGSPVTVEGSNILFRMDRDRRTPGYIQDSAKLWVYLSATSPAQDFSIYGYTLKDTRWYEGDSLGTPDSCAVSWDSLRAVVSGSASCSGIDWEGNGASGTTTDRNGTPVCSTTISASTPAGWVSFLIPGSALTDDFFLAGFILAVKNGGAVYNGVTFYADDWAVSSTQRPYFEGWETQPSLIFGAGVRIGP